MELNEENGCPNPQDLTLHRQIREASHLLKPELLRLHSSQGESTPNSSLYNTFIEEMKLIKSEISNCDALYACRNILDHMGKVHLLVTAKALNKEILQHLQEVMALLFKLQNLPS